MKPFFIITLALFSYFLVFLTVGTILEMPKIQTAGIFCLIGSIAFAFISLYSGEIVKIIEEYVEG